ncbi:uncharacterized protein DS421_2g39680 [Arachis hypogaea]|nr:uncharacterized protein DS421_2g39680 [Arachis hypogaea]
MVKGVLLFSLLVFLILTQTDCMKSFHVRKCCWEYHLGNDVCVNRICNSVCQQHCKGGHCRNYDKHICHCAC